MADTSLSELDDCFQIELPFNKIRYTLFLTPSRLLIIYGPNLYAVMDILSRSETRIEKEGRMPHRCEDIKKLTENRVLLSVDHYLTVFDVLEEKVVYRYEIGRAEVYAECFGVQVIREEESVLALFWKSSALRSNPVTVYYEIHLLQSIENELRRIRKLRTQYPDIRRFSLLGGEVFSYQLKGFTVEVTFIESNITQKIQSIYPLFLLEVTTDQHWIKLDFTHQQLQNDLARYTVSKDTVKKPQRIGRKLESHTVHINNHKRSLVFKNWINRSHMDPKVGIVKVVTEKESKYLHLLERVGINEASAAFKQTVLALLK